MLTGNILDVYPDYKNNVMVTWLIQKRKTVRIEEPYEPSFYVYSSPSELYTLASLLKALPEVQNITFTARKITLGSDKKTLVLEVTPKHLRSLGKLAYMIDAWGTFHKYQLFNVDLRLPTRYLQHKGVFCNALVSWNGKRFSCEEGQWDIDYDMPVFTTATMNIQHETTAKRLSFTEGISSISINDACIACDNEVDTILAAVEHLHNINPDILYTHQGDSILFPYLYYRATECGIRDHINLGRDKTQRCRPAKQAKSYFSYGNIIYRPAFYTLYGRAHIDRHHSFLYGESGLNGIVDISRCSNIPLQLLSRLGPGTAISQIQVNAALEKGYLIPWKKTIPETWKTARDLLVADRGGLILEPAVGLHEKVIELDFASLYPNIMLKFNISPETMLCSCCHTSLQRVPQLTYHICTKKQGLIPEVLEPILHRRFCFKARAKNKRYDTKLYKELQMAWKWILLVCFGYTGYRNARYGRIECYESITAFSREILLTAMEVAEQAGYRVLHGIVDSLWIEAEHPLVSPTHLSRRISTKTGIKMDVEGQYHWIVFLPCKEGEVGALNRYYGLFTDGSVKVRGIELRQRNAPHFLKKLQQEMLAVLSQASSAQEFTEVIPKALEMFQTYGRALLRKEVDNNDLVITTRISRAVSAYKVNTIAKAALLQVRDLGMHVEPGQSISYIVSDEHTRNYRDRVCIVESLEKDKQYDNNYYLRQCAKCAESILIPFGYTQEKLETMLNKVQWRETTRVSVLP